VDDPAEFFAFWIEDEDTTGSAAIDIPPVPTFMPSGTPGSAPRKLASSRSVCLASVPFAATSKVQM
jgi:hypothetical protein